MRIYIISDRRLRPDLDPADLMDLMAGSGADMVQIREKDLPASQLMSLARRAVEAGGVEVYVNGRPDVALASGSDGVHLPGDGLPAGGVRNRWPQLRVGASTHGREQAVAAQAAGAQFITCGPVFDTPSKRSYGPPIGVGGLAEAASAVSLPVFAIGGIHPGNVAEVARLKIAGVAVISAVIREGDMPAAVARLREAAA